MVTTKMETSSERQQSILPDSTTVQQDFIILGEDGAGLQVGADTGGMDSSLTDLMIGKHNYFLSSETGAFLSDQRSTSVPGKKYFYFMKE